MVWDLKTEITIVGLKIKANQIKVLNPTSHYTLSICNADKIPRTSDSLYSVISTNDTKLVTKFKIECSKNATQCVPLLTVRVPGPHNRLQLLEIPLLVSLHRVSILSVEPCLIVT